MSESHYEHLILMFLSGSISPEEKKQLLAWLEERSENKDTFDEYQRVWSLTNKKVATPDFKTKEEWQRLEASINEAEKEGSKRKTSYLGRIYAFRIAASVAIVLTFAAAIYFFNFRNEVLVKESTHEKVHFVLPDGSEVWLNRQSKITYSEDFNEEERILRLTGEAFFNVKRNPERPFTIIADKAKVRVLGTSFNVKAYGQDLKTEVFVLTGKVSLSATKEDKKVIVLRPGEKGLLLKKNGSLLMEKEENPNAIAWKSNKLVFSKTELHKVIITLEDYFGIKVKVRNPELLKCRFTSSFTNPDLEEVLEALRLSLNLTISHEGKNYTMDGKGC